MKFNTILATLALGATAKSSEIESQSDAMMNFMNAFGEPIGPLANCGEPSDLFEFEDLSVAPYPIIAGKPVTISVRGNLASAMVQGAKVNLVAKLGFVKVADETLDFCESIKEVNMECPVAAGPITIQATRELPAIIPKANVKVEIRVTNGDGIQAACLQGKVSIS